MDEVPREALAEERKGEMKWTTMGRNSWNKALSKSGRRSSRSWRNI